LLFQDTRRDTPVAIVDCGDANRRNAKVYEEQKGEGRSESRIIDLDCGVMAGGSIVYFLVI
jgi:hypothetical protein